ncbi:MAG: DNRLRE domain-containing protein [Kiritimatiellales bacterium]
MKQHVLNVIFALLLCSGLLRGETVNLSPVADAHANSAAPNSYYGTSGELWVRSFSGTDALNSMKIYLRFKLPADVVSVTSAELTFIRTTAASTLPYRLYGLKPESAGQNWSETQLSWNNAPANNPASISEVTPDASGVLADVTWNAGVIGTAAVIPTTAELVSFLNRFSGGDEVTLILVQNQDSAQMNKLASRENTTYSGPVLTLTYSTGELKLFILH